MRCFRNLLFVALSSMALLGCSEDIDLEKERRSLNEKNFLSFDDSVGYTQTYLPGLAGDNYVYKCELKKGSGTESPRYTDKVTFHYRLYLTSDWVRLGSRATVIEDNLSTETSLLRAAPASSYVPGVTMALQTMVVGDKVRVVLPWFLGYGAVSTSSIPGYSSLLFELDLVSIQK